MITTAIIDTARAVPIPEDRASTNFNGMRFDEAEAIARDAAEAAIKAINFEIASSTDNPEIAAKIETMVMTYLAPSVVLSAPDSANSIIESIQVTDTVKGLFA